MRKPRRLALLLLLAAPGLAGCTGSGEAVGQPGYRAAPGFYSGAGVGPSVSSGGRISAPRGND